MMLELSYQEIKTKEQSRLRALSSGTMRTEGKGKKKQAEDCQTSILRATITEEDGKTETHTTPEDNNLPDPQL